MDVSCSICIVQYGASDSLQDTVMRILSAQALDFLGLGSPLDKTGLSHSFGNLIVLLIFDGKGTCSRDSGF